jgi:hydroxyacyl-ACP dehydratase HTD2-like protein with hotdog domain
MPPPVPERTVVKLNSVQKQANGMSVNELREELREVYNGDPDMLVKYAVHRNYFSPHLIHWSACSVTLGRRVLPFN